MDAYLDNLKHLAEIAQRDDRDAAVAELMSVYVHHRPDDARGWYLLGDAQRVLGLNNEAERALLRSWELKTGQRWFIEIRLAQLYEDWGNSAEAERWYAAARGWPWIMRGGNLARQGLLQAAEECHRRAIPLDNCDRDEAYLNLGLVLRAQGRYDEAVEAFKAALALTPDYEKAQQGLRSLIGISDAIELARNKPDGS